METKTYRAADIEEIASKVLGKTSDGKTMMRYETPDAIDPSLLVGIPRYLNREDYGIKEDALPFFGIDAWNGYEFSCLLNNGFPVSGWLKWCYRSDSKNIVESKSIKLYLNSFNMAKMGATVIEAVLAVEERIHHDLAAILGVENSEQVQVKLHLTEDAGYANPMAGTFLQLEDEVEVENISFNQYSEDPNILVQVHLPDVQTMRFQSKSLRSNCRVTNQPDWGDIYIHVRGRKRVTAESLLQYIVSMRKENHFHEEICECVYKRLWDMLEPQELMVACLYTRRGGIDINPVRASNTNLLLKQPVTWVQVPSRKTQRQ